MPRILSYTDLLNGCTVCCNFCPVCLSFGSSYICKISAFYDFSPFWQIFYIVVTQECVYHVSVCMKFPNLNFRHRFWNVNFNLIFSSVEKLFFMTWLFFSIGTFYLANPFHILWHISQMIWRCDPTYKFYVDIRILANCRYWLHLLLMSPCLKNVMSHCPNLHKLQYWHIMEKIR